MTKGIPWPVDDEKMLKSWVASDIGLDIIVFSFDGKYSKAAVQQKMLDLGLRLNEEKAFEKKDSPELLLGLPSVEDALKMLNDALTGLVENPGMDRDEVTRLRNIILAVKIYKELIADYLDYCRLESEVMEWKKKYAEIVKKTQDSKPQ
jgi:hypothetical protein